jgi:predicted TIM-barrel fold metal-dependent hydrolase
MIIDCQVHGYDANTARRPWRDSPNWPAHVTGDEMIAAMDQVGVDGAILVSPFTMYGYDASYAIEAQRAHSSRLAIVKPVDTEDPAVAEIITDWKATPGAVGIRVMLTKAFGLDAADPGLDRVLRASAHHDLPVNLLCWENLEIGTAVIDRHPSVRFVIDHMGIHQPHEPGDPPASWDDLPKVLELARRPNVVIKVSAACTMSHQPYPFDDIWAPLARVFEAWGLERCLWGTDWTRTAWTLTYKEAVDAFMRTDRLTDADRAMLMGGACAKTYGWSPKIS